MIDTTLDLALEFLSAHPNWYIFPIRRLEKSPPLIENNLVDASNDPKIIRQWHAKWRGCNWGLALAKSGVQPMDVDTKPGKLGQQTYDTLVLEHGELPDTFTVRSPSGGLHYYFNGEHKFKLNAFGPDIDSPQYLLIPGCWICENFEQGYEIFNDVEVANAPAWFAEYFVERDATADSSNLEDDAVSDIDLPANIDRMIRYLQEGAPPSIQGKNGDKTMYDVVCVLKDNAISENMTVQLINTYYNIPGKCEPLWLIGSGPDADRLDVKVRNVFRYARENKIGTATAEYAFGGEDTFTEQDREELKVLDKHWRETLPPRREALREKLRADKAASQRKPDDEIEPDKPLVDENDNDPLEPPPDPPPAPPPPPPDVDDSDFLAAGDVVVDDSDFTSDDDKASAENEEAPADEEDDSGAEAPPDEEPVTGGTFKDVCSQWVWVVGLERFIRVKDSKMWSRTQFDSRFNHFVDTASVSANIFKTAGAIRRFDGACFRPGQKMVLPPDFNLWRMSKIVPKEGNTDLWNEHLNYLFQNQEDKDHVLNWLAWVYQNQARKPNHALLLVGKNTGTGKSFIARVFEQLIGKENTQRPKNSSLKGDFNGWALKCKLCIIEELMQIGRREVANELRDIITEPTVEVNIKNVPAQLVENYMAMMGISNHPDALPIDDTDRRWLVIATNATRRLPDYYRKLFEILEGPKSAEMLAAIAYELKTRKLGDYDASQAAPDTEAKREMITLSRSDVDTWLVENLQNQPLCRTVLTTADVIESMPSVLQRSTRLNVVVVNFLRDKADGVILGQYRTKDGRRQRLWGLHGAAAFLKKSSEEWIVAQYEAQRKGKSAPEPGALSEEEQAMQDFTDQE